MFITRPLFYGMKNSRLLLYIVFFYTFFPSSVAGAVKICSVTPNLISNIKEIGCIVFDLRTAIQKDDLLRKFANTNFFASLNSNDVVRSVENLSFFNHSLLSKIEDTHKQYQEADKESYTLSIASYPSVVEKGSCALNKTIDFQSSFRPSVSPQVKSQAGQELDMVGIEKSVAPVYQWYSVISGKQPLSFQVRHYKSRLQICASSDMPYKKRLNALCGQIKEKNCWGGDKDECEDHIEAYNKCKRQLPPSCAYLDKKGAIQSSQDMCVSIDAFSSISKDLLMSNTSLENQYCPDGCSYYTQTIQRVYKKTKSLSSTHRNNSRHKQKKKPEAKYCSDSYLIVHCGPKKDESKYNLNIREMSNLCSDFNSPFCTVR